MDQSAMRMERREYFPTMVYQTQLPSSAEMNSALLQAIKRERARDEKGLSRSNFPQLGGWHSRNDLHKNQQFDNLLGHVSTAFRWIENDLNYHQDFDLKVEMMWAIVNAPGSSNRSHIHPGFLWSGVYYVQVPEHSGDIEFQDPRTENLILPAVFRSAGERPKECRTKERVTPSAGTMLLFPSWLYHAVHPNTSTLAGELADRVIISFNCRPRKRGHPADTLSQTVQASTDC